MTKIDNPTTASEELQLRSTFSTKSTQALVSAAHSTTGPIRYEILYLKLHGMAATTRAILAIANVQWKSIYAKDWANVEKKLAPMGVMPILYEIHEDSNVILEIPESEAIERYLARKFNLFGSDLWEETAINVFYTSSNAVMSIYINKVLLAFPDTKARELAKFVQKDIPAWIEHHEKWLTRNGSNGHYVGNE
ncbi:hypothetical protein BGZ94_007578, partial [Podila epigama]